MRWIYTVVGFFVASILTPAPAIGQTTDLSCKNDLGGRWNITLNEQTGLANVVRLLRDDSEELIPDSPAIFTANEVRIDASGQYRKTTSLIFVVDRTTLAMKIYSGVNLLGPPKYIGTAQCEIAAPVDRKF
jgi:hypothetical protein